MSSTNRINVELSDPLIDNSNGFRIASETLEELFEQDNIAKDKETEQSKSNNILMDTLGGTDQVVAALKSDPKMGIDQNEQEITARKARYGDNVRIKREIQTVCQMICGVFEDFILQVLCVAAVVSTIIGLINEGWPIGMIEGVSILVAILIITVVTVSQDYAKEKQFQKMMETDDIKNATIIRGGNQMVVDTTELVVGDILVIGTGDMIPADGIVLETNDLSISEAQLTGEPHGKAKEPLTAENFASVPCPFIVQGSLVETGTCKAITCAVGNRTAQGKAGLSMNMEADQTPLQKKLDSIANTIGKLGTYVAILTFIAITIRTLCLVFIKGDREFSDKQNLTDILDGFIIAVTIIVVAVPEGLPLAVAIALYVASSQMEAEHNLVRRMKAAETMGNANEICTDKTGTLTKNQMTVMDAYYLDKIVPGTQSSELANNQIGQLLNEAICFNSSAFIDVNPDDGSKKTQGNVTEVGIIDYLTRSGLDAESLIDTRVKDLQSLLSLPFSSARKRSSNVVKHPSQAGLVRCYVKGAPDMVMKSCTKIILADGEVHELTDEKKDSILGPDVIKVFADQCRRTILVAYRDFTEADWESFQEQNGGFETLEQKQECETDLTVLAIFALQDPLRDNIADTVDIMHRAGINVRMVTGDFIDTAVAISKEAHIISQEDMESPDYNEEYACMTGEKFRNAVKGSIKAEDGKVVAEIGNKNLFRKIIPHLKVLARSSPNDKFVLVHGLIEEGKTVAVTGDGTNDAPALNRADVGFAMGITGTDVAKNSADIVLTDDNFNSIQVAVKFGRNIYDNVKKFLQFQLTVNVVAMFIVFSGSIIFEETPLNAVQMLWVNLIMDTLASLALATEPPADSIMLRQPSSKSDKIVDSIMWRNIFGQAIFQIIALFCLLVWGREWFGLPYDNSEPLYAERAWLEKYPERNAETCGPGIDQVACVEPMYMPDSPTNKCEVYTIVFQTFVMCQIFNMVNARKLLNDQYNVFADFFNNIRFLIVLVIIIIVQITLVYIGGRAFKTVPLDTVEQIVCVSIGCFSLVWGLIIKLIMPPKMFDWMSIDEKELDDKEVLDTVQGQFRRSYRHSRTMRNSSVKVHNNSDLEDETDK